MQRLSRRSFLSAGVASAGVAAVGTRAGSAAPLKRRANVRVGWSGAGCEAATYVTFEKGFFAREGLDVELVRLRDPLAAHDAIAAGTIDAVTAPLYSWLGPIQRGLDARLTAGLHGGCIRLVAGSASRIRELGDIKGVTIATDRLGGSTMDFFASLLRKREIDPVRDVRWRVYRPAEFAGALQGGAVQVVAAADPAGYSLIRDHRAVAITDELSAGIFYCDRGISHSHNCFIVIRGALVRTQPRVAARLTWAWRDATRWVGAKLPLAFVVLPTSFTASIFILALATWFPVTFLTWSGVRAVNRSYYDVARTLGAGEWFLIWNVAVPAALPSIFVGIFMGLGTSFVTLLAAEMLGVKAGLGWYVTWAQGWAAYPKVYAALAIMALLFSGLISILFRVRNRMLRWERGSIR